VLVLVVGGSLRVMASAPLHGGELPGMVDQELAARIRDAFPVLGSPAGLAAEATVCAQLLQTVARGDNLVLEDQLRNWNSATADRAPGA